ncbi:MAG: N(4)-(beta-N-acetylglucosaminyl)-L-asparaginase [Phycisphaerales bacterium]|nr:N(4)-(beta-N-acetylglucosaminyl)-L-asparaginase [Phycisphaerales bacterium]
MSDITRRDFVTATAATAACAAVGVTPTYAAAIAPGGGAQPVRAAAGPVIVGSGNCLSGEGYRQRCIDRVVELLAAGKGPLEAVVEGVALVEADPKDMSVGYGGLPNEEGVVELDASVMDGVLHRSGAVGGLQRIMHPARVAKLVLERTDHCMLVGEGALKFARAHGFEEMNLLTNEAREAWLKWKETHSEDDDWIPPEVDENGKQSARWRAWPFSYGTINCCALDVKGNLAGVTTTSGLSYKLPGRVGDSPIIGAGLYVDNEVGAAGSTGRGEAVIQICGAHTVVEAMRQGKSPKDACLEACDRVVKKNRLKRLQTKDGRPNFGLNFYAVNNKGEHGGASIWSGSQYAAYVNGEAKLVPSAFLFETEK